MGNLVAIQEYDQIISSNLQGFSYQKILCDMPHQKTLLCYKEGEGQVVTKFISTHVANPSNQNQKKKMDEIHCKLDLGKHPNVLSVSPIYHDFPKLGFTLYQVRQFIYLSLREKISHSIPKLTHTEKLWIVWQILAGISQIHSLDCVHGDLKPDNILVTSSNQVFVTDIATYKPTYIQSVDHQRYNMFFGELDNNKKCFMAPERFIDSVEDQVRQPLEKSMDIFSAGCIIAELFIETQPLFDLKDLQNYRIGNYDPVPDLQLKINDPNIVSLIMEMVHLDPKQRPSIIDCIQRWMHQVFPRSFSRIFFPLNSCFVRAHYIFSDLRISLIRKYFPSIYKCCFDSQLSTDQIQQKLFEPIERVVYDKLRDDGIIEHNHQTEPVKTTNDFLDIGSDQKIGFENNEQDKKSALVVIHWIGSYLDTCMYPQSRRCGLEMLLIIGKASSFEIRLQYILPYVIHLFEDKQPKVVAKAIEVSVLLFEDLLETDQNYILTNTDHFVFINYIWEHFFRTYHHFVQMDDQLESQLIKVTCHKYLPLLGQIGRRFTEISIKSRLISIQQGVSQIDGNDQPSKQNQLRQVNYDKELNTIRNKVHTIINNAADLNKQPLMLSITLPRNLGKLCDFYGSTLTLESVPQLMISGTNIRRGRGDFMIKLAFIKSIVGVALKVGKEYLCNIILSAYVTLLNDPEELVVLEFLRVLCQLLQLKLIKKTTLISFKDNSQKSHKGLQEYQEFSIDIIIPFLLHPNTQIREAALNFILILCDFDKTQILSKADVFCIMKEKLTPYFQQSQDLLFILLNPGSVGCEQLLGHLRNPLSRDIYDSYVKSDIEKFDNLQSLKQSESDKYAFDKMKNIIIITQKKYQSSKKDKTFYDGIPLQSIQNSQLYPVNKVIRVSSYEKVEQASIVNPKILKDQIVFDQGSELHPYSSQFMNTFYESSLKRKGAEQSYDQYNMGLNTWSLERSKNSTLTEFIMQALYIHPDSKAFKGQDSGKNTQFTIQSQDFQSQSQFDIQRRIGQSQSLEQETEKTDISKLRLQGRLIQTLYSHKEPVNCLTVSEDNKLLFTGSRNDSLIHIWDTSKFGNEPTNSSLFSLKTDRKPNSIATFQNNELFAVGGSDEGVDIYSFSRVLQSKPSIVNRQSYTFKNQTSLNYQLPNQTQIVQTLQHYGSGDVMTLMSSSLPSSNQDVLIYTTQKGSIFVHDVRCRKPANSFNESFTLQRGLITCAAKGQDAYQIIYGSVGGYVMLYDLRYNVLSSIYRHSMNYPINSVSIFKPDPSKSSPIFNRSKSSSLMAAIASGGPNYELSLLNMESGDIEYLMTTDEEGNGLGVGAQNIAKEDGKLSGHVFPSFYRESEIRDPFNWPEKFERSNSLFDRYMAHSKALINSHKLKLIQNIDDQLFKSTEHRYRLLIQSFQSPKVCSKILIPRLSDGKDSQFTTDFVITGGKDRRIRQWSLSDPVRKSFLINTPNNDEVNYFSEFVGGGMLVVKEQLCKQRAFPVVDLNLLNETAQPQKDTLMIPNTCIELSRNSTYYSILSKILQQKYPDKIADKTLMSVPNAKKILSQLSQNELGLSGSGAQFQFQLQKDKIIVQSINGLSEWQHLNGLNMNYRVVKDAYQDRWTSQLSQKVRNANLTQKKDTWASESLFGNQTGQSNPSITESSLDLSMEAQLFRDSQTVSHSGSILEMAFIQIESQKNQFQSGEGSILLQEGVTPLLVTSGWDGVVKIWR